MPFRKWGCTCSTVLEANPRLKPAPKASRKEYNRRCIRNELDTSTRIRPDTRILILHQHALARGTRKVILQDSPTASVNLPRISSPRSLIAEETCASRLTIL